MAEQISRTVLVIDDAHIRSSIEKFLIARGYTVIEAANMGKNDPETKGRGYYVSFILC